MTRTFEQFENHVVDFIQSANIAKFIAPLNRVNNEFQVTGGGFSSYKLHLPSKDVDILYPQKRDTFNKFQVIKFPAVDAIEIIHKEYETHEYIKKFDVDVAKWAISFDRDGKKIKTWRGEQFNEKGHVPSNSRCQARLFKKQLIVSLGKNKNYHVDNPFEHIEYLLKSEPANIFVAGILFSGTNNQDYMYSSHSFGEPAPVSNLKDIIKATTWLFQGMRQGEDAFNEKLFNSVLAYHGASVLTNVFHFDLYHNWELQQRVRALVYIVEAIVKKSIVKQVIPSPYTVMAMLYVAEVILPLMPFDTKAEREQVISAIDCLFGEDLPWHSWKIFPQMAGHIIFMAKNFQDYSKTVFRNIDGRMARFIDQNRQTIDQLMQHFDISDHKFDQICDHLIVATEL